MPLYQQKALRPAPRCKTSCLELDNFNTAHSLINAILVFTVHIPCHPTQRHGSLNREKDGLDING